MSIPERCRNLAKGTGVGRSERPRPACATYLRPPKRASCSREPLRRRQGRTLLAKSTHAPDPCKSSLLATSSHSPQMSIDRLLRSWRAVYPCPFLHSTDGYACRYNRLPFEQFRDRIP